MVPKLSWLVALAVWCTGFLSSIQANPPSMRGNRRFLQAETSVCPFPILIEEEGGPSVVPIEVVASDGSTVSFRLTNTFVNRSTADVYAAVQHQYSYDCPGWEDLEPGALVGEIIQADCRQSMSYSLVHLYVDSPEEGILPGGKPIDPELFERSPCCNTRPSGTDPPKKLYTYKLSCLPCGGSITTGSPTTGPTSGPTTGPTLGPTPLPGPIPRTQSLQEEILLDMMPETASQCVPKPANISYDFVSNQAESQWAEPFADLEEYVFKAKMAYQDANANRSWTLRFGPAGNIYSMVGPMGETVPPQKRTDSPWMDEVWQAIQPLGPSGDNDGDPNTEVYFIHEAGVYQRDGANTALPIFSPSLGSYCDPSTGECGFLTWGQQAHLPTPWVSPMLFFSRYVNCGDGVFEYTTLRHNSVGSPDVFGFMNTPWGGTRNTVLQDIVLSDSQAQELQVQFPLPAFNEGRTKSLGKTLGFTVFAEDLPKVSALDGQPYPLPNGLDLTTRANCSADSRNNRYVCPLVEQPKDIGFAPNRAAPGLLVRLVGVNGKSIIAGVRHWAAGARLFFYMSSSLTLASIQEAIPIGTTLQVQYYLPAEGKPTEDNLALMHVHGGQNLPTNQPYPRVRYGKAGRDFNVYTINTLPQIRGGDTYFYRQYFAFDSYDQMEATGRAWADQTLEQKYPVDARPGRIVSLYSDGSSKFGHTLGTASCEAASGTTTTLVCQGTTTPQSNTQPLVQIQCGTSVVVTTDLYALSPPGPPYRGYQCDGLAPGTQPAMVLLGFFEPGLCASIAEGVVYEEDFCQQASR